MELLVGVLVLIRIGCVLMLMWNVYIDYYVLKKNWVIFFLNMFLFKINFCGLVGLEFFFIFLFL